MIIEKYKWIKRNNDKALGSDKTAKQIIDAILEDRGIITKEEKNIFLSPSLDKMHDPMDLPDMGKAIGRIEKAKKDGEKITIYGDYDVDGITSTSILYMFLKENGYNIDYYIPDRVSEGYGFNTAALEEIRNMGASLLISVDTGISANKEVIFAKNIGLDIIITDHHECMEVLPDAHAIVNPKRPDSNYPFKELAGVGVTFKLIHALAIRFGNVDTIWKYIDIVAVGTIADIVPLVDENRIIVKNAFNTIPTTWNLGLDALLEVSKSKGKKISAGTIGFQIGPRLNAAGRLGDAKKGVELFTTKDRDIANDIAKELDDENTSRKAIEQEIFDLAVEKIEEDKKLSSNRVIVVASEGWHTGVIGIVASRITELYYKPSIVISIDKDGRGTGSARSIEGFSMFDALCNSGHFLEQFGGHDMAAGLSLDYNKIDDFREHINEYGQVIIDDEMLKRKMKIDCELYEQQITVPMAEALEDLEPYGVGNPSPIFSYKAKVYSSKAIGTDGKHLKMQLYTPDRLIDCVGFNMGYQSRIIEKDEDILIAGNLQKNEWLGKVTPQMLIKDIKSLGEERNKSEYYLSLYKKMPEPTGEKLKLFTNSSESCYISSYSDNLDNMIPTRDDAVAVYRYLKQAANISISEESIYAIKKEVSKQAMSEYKILQILDIFKELGLLQYSFDEADRIIRFKIIEGIKNDLSNSKRYMQLSKLGNN